MEFEELLQTYKDNPRREATAVLLQDSELFRFCVIWMQVPTRRWSDAPRDETWPALWDCVHVDIGKIALLGDVTEVEAMKMVERMKGMRLVYPDGSVQELVKKLIVKKLKDALE